METRRGEGREWELSLCVCVGDSPWCSVGTLGDVTCSWLSGETVVSAILSRL